jgi:hypothetical protein
LLTLILALVCSLLFRCRQRDLMALWLAHLGRAASCKLKRKHVLVACCAAVIKLTDCELTMTNFYACV